MSNQNNNSRKKSIDPLDVTYTFAREQMKIASRFPNLPPQIKDLHQQLIKNSWDEFDKLKQDLPQQTEISSL